MLYRRFCYVIILVVSIALFPTPDVNAKDSSVIDAKADKVLRQMSEYLNSLEQFTFHAENTEGEILSTGQKLQRGITINLSVRRPVPAESYHLDPKPGSINLKPVVKKGR
jgi:hypothetical protein